MTSRPSSADLVGDAYAMAVDAVLASVDSSAGGLSPAEARARLERYGPNRLEPPRPPAWWRMLARQFASPLIFILMGAAVVALLLGEVADAGFIAAVLLVNAVIGFVNEARAERKVRSLAGLVRTRSRVWRGGETVELDGDEIVPGDIVLLESGNRVPADVRVVDANALRVEEGILTGESVPVNKEPAPVPVGTALAERGSMAFAGTLVASGRGVAVVVATAGDTEVGAIARQMEAVDPQPPPLILRMRRFAHVVGVVVLGVSAVVILLGVARGQPLAEVLLGAIALAVSAVPEGLPIALTVALAVAVSRMAGREVVVRHLPAVEALGSCGVIATDKTGTLTRNQLTVECVLAERRLYELTGVGYEPVGDLLLDGSPVPVAEHHRLYRLLRAGALANEATLVRRADKEEWSWSGDPTDVALLSAACKAGLDLSGIQEASDEVVTLPFESERRYTASFRVDGTEGWVFVKGAPERVLEMCEAEAQEGGGQGAPLDVDAALLEARELMGRGYRVLAIAEGRLPEPPVHGRPPPRAVPTGPAGLRGDDRSAAGGGGGGHRALRQRRDTGADDHRRPCRDRLRHRRPDRPCHRRRGCAGGGDDRRHGRRRPDGPDPAAHRGRAGHAR